MNELTTNQNKLPSDQMAPVSFETLQSLIVGGDLSKLNPQQMVEYYTGFCSRIGLDPVTQPFKVLVLNGKKTLYCDRGGTAQLNKKHGVTHTITAREKADDLYIVTVKASLQDGRATESIGAVSIINLKGESLANAMMKAETKAKRRSTLDLVGLGMLDESELESIPGAQTQPIPTQVTVIDQEHKPLPPIEEKERTERRKWRAKVNKMGQECKSLEDISKAVKTCEETLKEFFDTFTYHNETETFRSLLSVHAARIQDELARKSPEGISAWIATMRKATTQKDFADFVAVYAGNDYLQTEEVEAALEEVAIDFELQNWRELIKES